MSSEEGTSRFKQGERIAKISVLVMIVLTIVKGSIGLVYDSISLIADAINSLADILASALVWSGLRLAGREPNERFPYGYYRGETLASLLLSIMIIVTGGEIMFESLNRVFSPTQITEPLLPLLAALVSMIGYFILAKYKRKVGKQIGSRSLVADSTHSMVDVYSGVVVFIGIVLSFVGFPIVEVGVAILIGIYIIKEGLVLARDAVLYLMDAGVSDEMLGTICEVALKVPGVHDVHDVRVRRAGSVCFADMHLEVDSDLHVNEAHDIASKVEQSIKEELPELESVSIHIEPAERTRETIALCVDTDNKEIARLTRHFAKTPFFCFIEFNEGVKSEITMIENPAHSLQKRRGVQAASFLIENDINVLIVSELGISPFGILRSNHISIYDQPEGVHEISEILDLYISNELSMMKEPKDIETD